MQQAGFLVVDLYRRVLLQVEIAYFGWVGDVVQVQAAEMEFFMV